MLLRKDGIHIDTGFFDYEIDDLYEMHFESRLSIKKSIISRTDEELIEFTEFLAGYDDHIDNVIWEMSESMKDEYLNSKQNLIDEIERFDQASLMTEIVEFVGLFGDRSFTVTNR
jgi:hypothetical protein